MHCCIEKQETMSAAYEQGVSYVPSIPMKSTSDAASGCMTNVDVYRRIWSKTLQEESFGRCGVMNVVPIYFSEKNEKKKVYMEKKGDI